VITRYIGLSGRLYEHRNGADWGVREWPVEEQVWWCLHKGQQRYDLDFQTQSLNVSSPENCFIVSILFSASVYISWHLLSKCSFVHQHVEADPYWWCIDGLEPSVLPCVSCNFKAVDFGCALTLMHPFNLCTCCLGEVGDRENVSHDFMGLSGAILM